MGVLEHFPICGIFVGFFVLLYFGIFVWDFFASGAGIPAPSDAIDVCLSKHQSALIRGDGDSQLHCRAEGPRTKATEQMSESCCFRKQTASS